MTSIVPEDKRVEVLPSYAPVKQEHTVVTFDFVNLKGEIVSTHAGYDSDLANIPVPVGLKLKIRPNLKPQSAKALQAVVVNYVIPRVEEYPSVGDQLGVLWRLLEQRPELLNDEARAMLTRINAVKSTYSKGNEYVQNSGPEGDKYKLKG